jgi:prophage maintenance system killer protein
MPSTHCAKRILRILSRNPAQSYGCGLVKHHPFIDGNKRIGFMVAVGFLQLNGWRLEAKGIANGLGFLQDLVESLLNLRRHFQRMKDCSTDADRS